MDLWDQGAPATLPAADVSRVPAAASGVSSGVRPARMPLPMDARGCQHSACIAFQQKLTHKVWCNERPMLPTKGPHVREHYAVGQRVNAFGLGQDPPMTPAQAQAGSGELMNVTSITRQSIVAADKVQASPSTFPRFPEGFGA